MMFLDFINPEKGLFHDSTLYHEIVQLLNRVILLCPSSKLLWGLQKKQAYLF